MKEIGIYVHIPFCEQKCIYCDFASFVCQDRNEYFDRLIKEIENAPKGLIAKTIYFGGGTPSIVDPIEVYRVLEKIKNSFQIAEDCEFTIECNPNSATLEKLQNYRQMGFNRISFGAQSLHDDVLKRIGRVHNSKEVIESIKNSKKAGFCNISIDLMIGLPNQNTLDLIEDASKVLDDVTHISTYTLQVENGTPLAKMVEKKEMILPTDDEVAEMYNSLAEFLKNHDFERYEISNFAKLGYESKHNMNYWKRGEYLGFGLSAYSFFEGKRFGNSRVMKEYLLGQNVDIEEPNTDESITELIMLGLRCKLGFSLKQVEYLGYNLSQNNQFKKLLEKGILRSDGDRVFLNPNYYEISNQIICEILK